MLPAFNRRNVVTGFRSYVKPKEVYVQWIGAGEPLVLFHGWGFDSQIWGPLLPYLKERYRLGLVDLPGAGRTAMMSWDSFYTLLLAQLPPYYHLLGWSLGGLIATKLALHAPMRVKTLVNLASTPHFIQIGDWPGVEIKIMKRFYQRFVHDPMRTRNQFIRWQFQGMLLPKYKPRSSLQGLQAGLDVLLTWDLRADLIYLPKCVYYLFGALDPIVPKLTMDRMHTSYRQCQTRWFPHGGHVFFLSHPALFSDLFNELVGAI